MLFRSAITSGGDISIVDGQTFRSSGNALLSRNNGTGVIGIGSGNVSDSLAFFAGGVNQMTLSTSGVLNIATIAHTGGTAIQGTNTNDSASAGYIGEYKETLVTGAPSWPAADNHYGDFGSISLTAGDWDVTFIVDMIANGATVTGMEIGISTHSGDDSTGLSRGINDVIVTGAAAGGVYTCLVVPSYRVSVSTTTTYYGKLEANYSVATPVYLGRLSARRVR